MMKKKIVPIIIGVVIFAVGFFSGIEYSKYKIRSALSDAFSETGLSSETETRPAKNEVVITKAIGDEVELATQIWKAVSVKESQSISSKYGTPKVAKEGTKFVIVNMDVTNTTKDEFMFEPYKLEDNFDRQYSTYSDSIGSVDNYLNVRTLSPGVKENGNIVYEIPSDSTGYSLLVLKAGTNETYKIVLK